MVGEMVEKRCEGIDGACVVGSGRVVVGEGARVCVVVGVVVRVSVLLISVYWSRMRAAKEDIYALSTMAKACGCLKWRSCVVGWRVVGGV